MKTPRFTMSVEVKVGVAACLWPIMWAIVQIAKLMMT
jgi:hypothetical protein